MVTELQIQNLEIKILLQAIREVTDAWKRDDQDIARNLSWSVKDVQSQLGISFEEAKHLKQDELKELIEARRAKATIIKKLGELTNIYLDAESEEHLEVKRTWKQKVKELISFLEELIND